MGIKKPRYPTREYLGKFESWLLIMKSSKTFRAYDKALERLFTMFPHRTGVEQFLSTDMADFKVIGLQNGRTLRSIEYDLRMYYIFWRWLMEDKGLPINNPARAFKQWKSEPSGKSLVGLTEVNLLLDQCSPTDKKIVLQVMCGRGSTWKARKIVRDAASKAGLVDFNLGSLKIATTHKLSRDIIIAYCESLLKDIDVQIPSTPDFQTNQASGYRCDKEVL